MSCFGCIVLYGTALSPALAGTRYVSSEILWGSKNKNFLGHFWLGTFIQDNLPVNPKQEVQPISQLLAGTEQKKDSSLDRISTSSNMQAAAFAVPICKDKQC